MKKVFVIGLFLAGWLLIACQSPENTQPTGQEIAPGKIKPLNKPVCAVNPRLMNKKEIPELVGNNINYGCCGGCVDALKNDTTSCFSFDIPTRQKVDLPDVVIIKKTGSESEVIYFASEGNPIKYMRSTAAK